MARTRWPPGPVNPGLLPRPGRSDRQRRWVPRTGARPTDRYQDNPSGVGRFAGQAGTRSPTLRPHHRKTAEAGPGALTHILPADYDRLRDCIVAGVTTSRTSGSGSGARQPSTPALPTAPSVAAALHLARAGRMPIGGDALAQIEGRPRNAMGVPGVLATSGSVGMPAGPGVDDVEHGGGRLGRYEAEHFLQQRVDDRVQPLLGERLVVVLGLPDIDIAQPVVGAPGQVGDQAVRALRAKAFLDPGVGLGVNRHVIGECVRHWVLPLLIRTYFGRIL